MTKENLLFDGLELRETPKGRDRAMDAGDKAFYGRTEPADGSADALEHMESTGKLKGHQAHVLAVLRQHDGSTSTELAQFTDYDLTETRRRLTDLKNLGRVVKGPSRKCKVQGNKQAVWKVKG